MRDVRRFGLLYAGTACLVLAPSCANGPAPQPTARSSAAITTASSPTINTFVVYAANNVTLGSGDHSVGGSIGVATSNGTSPELVVGSQDQLDVNQTVFAPAISVGNLAQIGAVETNSLTNNDGQVGTQSGYPSSMPPLPTIFAATAGTANVTVAAGHQQTLSPGNYGALTDNGVVWLNPGTYSFASVTLGNNAQLQALQGGSTSVLVAGALTTGMQAQILPAGQSANELTIAVSGSDGTNGNPPAVSVGAGTQLVGLLAAPNGTVSLANNVQATGAFAGVNFIAGTNVLLNFQSGFPNASPSLNTFVAYAELGLTLGSGVVSLGGDFGVAAVGASSAGAQLTVGSQDSLDRQHVVYAPSVSLAPNSAVGDIATNNLQNNGGFFGADAPYPTAMPLLQLPPSATNGTANVTVAQGQIQSIGPVT